MTFYYLLLLFSVFKLLLFDFGMKYYQLSLSDKYDHWLAFWESPCYTDKLHFCVKTGDIIKVLIIYRNIPSPPKTTYTLPLWAQVWRWWCVTSPPAVGSCSGPAAFLCLAPSAYTAAVYRCTSWAWPAGGSRAQSRWGRGRQGGGVCTRPLLPLRVSLLTKGQFPIQLIRKLLHEHDRHHKGPMHIIQTWTYNHFNLDLIDMDVKTQRIVEVSTQLN